MVLREKDYFWNYCQSRDILKIMVVRNHTATDYGPQVSLVIKDGK